MQFGIPPFPPSKAQKSPADQAFSEVRTALREECTETPVLYMVESKKLCLAIVEAYEVLGFHIRRHLPHDPAALFRTELQNQLMSFALMKLLPEEDVKRAAQTAAEKFQDAAGANPPVSKAGLMVRELEAMVDQTPQNEDTIKTELIAQALFRLSNRTPEVFANLEKHFPECATKIPMLLQGTNESLAQLLNSQFRPQLKQP